MPKASASNNATPATFALVYQFLELTAVASHVGKTLFANYLAALLRQLGIRVTLVRIESKVARGGSADIDIASEDFAQSAKLPGGEVAILRPLYAALQNAAQDKSVVILDWAGGLADYRLRIHAATRFDDRLADLGMRGLSLVVTTALADRIRQAADSVTHTKHVAPNLDCAVILNQRLGGFTFLPQTEEAKAFEKLQTAAHGLPMIRIAAVTGETWKACEGSGLLMEQVIQLELPELARRVGQDPWTASAFQLQVAAWWSGTEKAFLPVLGGANADRAG